MVLKMVKEVELRNWTIVAHSFSERQVNNRFYFVEEYNGLWLVK